MPLPLVSEVCLVAVLILFVGFQQLTQMAEDQLPLLISLFLLRLNIYLCQNYAAEYCDRIRDGQTRTCQQIGAQKRYDEKLQSNEAVGLFRKYYKRYYARTKVNQIKPDKFREWNYKTCEMRDKRQIVEITSAEFEEWLYSCFKNRKRKE